MAGRELWCDRAPHVKEFPECDRVLGCVHKLNGSGRKERNALLKPESPKSASHQHVELYSLSAPQIAVPVIYFWSLAL